VKVVTLDLPAPVSTNRRRKIDWASEPDHARWIKNADAHVLIAKSQGLKLERIERFEIEIVVDESVGFDLDNIAKSAIDFLRRINLIYDDNPKCMRKLTMTWGNAPAGIKIIVRPIE
jgi:Holliday junction resolvase RusA-like endonuclease